MTTPEQETIIDEEYRRAGEFYDRRVVPAFRGGLVLSQIEARELPIDLTYIYGLMDEEIAREPRKAQQHARSFGPTRVALALDARPTSFSFERYDSYPKTTECEITTRAVKQLGEIVCADEIDGPITYVLCNSGRPQTVEMSLVQAMHMVDTAEATGQYAGGTPLVTSLNIEDLLYLKAKYPDIFLRTYGNVRGLNDVPTVLGAVVSTALLEKANVPLNPLTQRKPKDPSPSTVLETSRENREKMAFVGITTAKRPHAGHSILLAKAIADSTDGNVLVELNDQGPRVDNTVRALAKARGETCNETAQALSNGDISVEEVERAYRQRGEPGNNSELNESYILTSNNRYYDNLLAKLQPPGITFTTVTNSSTQFSDSLPGYLPLFNGSGMGIVSDNNKDAFVVERAGKPTLQGVMVQLCGKYALKLVDSPPCLSRQELAILANNGYEVEQGSGCGLLLDFGSASGTNGKAPLLEELMMSELAPGAELAAIRLLMDRSYFFVSETGSICPNFADIRSFEDAYRKALADLDPDQIETIVKRPINLKNTQIQLVRQLLEPVYTEYESQGKVKAGEICKLIDIFPALVGILPAKVIARAANLDKRLSVPKNLLSSADYKLINAIRSGQGATLYSLIKQSCEEGHAYIGAYLSGTDIGDALSFMGYRGDSLMGGLENILKAKGVYTSQ